MARQSPKTRPQSDLRKTAAVFSLTKILGREGEHDLFRDLRERIVWTCVDS